MKEKRLAISNVISRSIGQLIEMSTKLNKQHTVQRIFSSDILTCLIIAVLQVNSDRVSHSLFF